MMASVSSTPTKKSRVITAPSRRPAPVPSALSFSTISVLTSSISRCTSSCTCSGRLVSRSRSERLRGFGSAAGSVIARRPSGARAGRRLLRRARRLLGGGGSRGRLLRGAVATGDLRHDLLRTVGDELGHLGRLVLHKVL